MNIDEINDHFEIERLMTKYVEAGWLGRKTNRGFYDYKGEQPIPSR